MSYIRYKTFGNKEYAYEVTSYWDREKKRSRQKTIYLGQVIDKEKGDYRRLEKKVSAVDDELILDFGDAFCIYQMLNRSDVLSILKISHPNLVDEISLLCMHKLINPTAMVHLNIWYAGSYSNRLIKNASLTSQRISEYLKEIGKEKYLRKFFSNYIANSNPDKKTLLIDTTALPNQIHMPLTSWGRSEGGIDKTIRFLFVVDKTNSKPLYFRYIDGSIPDVSVLSNTITELKNYQVNDVMAILDAGFFSNDNVTLLKELNIQYLTRLPSNRKIFKDLTEQYVPSIETVQNAYKYGKRITYIKKVQVDIAGNQLFAYVVLDPKTKAEKSTKYLLEILDQEITADTNSDFDLITKGIFILISSSEIEEKDLLKLYYERQKAEQLFGFLKDDLEILPLRVHQESTLKGYLFISFISLIIFIEIRDKLKNKYQFEEAMLLLKNLKVRTYGDNEIIGEPTKDQRLILECLQIELPNKPSA